MDYIDRQKLYAVIEGLIDDIQPECEIMIGDDTKNQFVEKTIVNIEKLNILKENS